MKMKLLIESFKKFLKENFQREEFDHALGLVLIALQDMGEPAYDASGNTGEYVEINGESYPATGGFFIQKYIPGIKAGRLASHYTIEGSYQYDNTTLTFTVSHQSHVPMNAHEAERFNVIKHIDNYSVKSVDDALGLADMIRRDYHSLEELFGEQP